MGNLDALVLRDGPVENHTVVAVFSSAIDKPVAVADAFGGDQNTFRVHAVEDIAEAFALLADKVLFRNFEVVEEDLVGFVIHHVADGAQRDSGTRVVFQPGGAQIDEENGKSVGLLLHVGEA